MRKRVTADRRPVSVTVHFDDVMSGSVNTKLDVESCVPFTRPRARSESGVLRLMNIFQGRAHNGNGMASIGLAVGSDMPIVVELSGSLRPYVYRHFQDNGLSEEEVETRVKSRSKWYGIVDGHHIHDAVTRLQCQFEEWRGFMWFVCLLKGGQPFERYRQLAVFQNARHDNSFYVETTFFDLVNNIKQQYHSLKCQNLNCSGVAVTEAYTGVTIDDKRSRTLVQMANTAIRMPDEVIAAIGTVCSEEYPDLCLCSPKHNVSDVKTKGEIMELVDCRVYRNMLNITSLKSAKVFMNATGVDGQRAQISTIFKSRDVCKSNQFKPVKHTDITRLFHLSLAAINEEKKFLRFLEPQMWPVEMKVLRENMMRSTILDRSINDNQGKADILEPLIDAYKRHFPASAPQRVARYARCIEIDSEKAASNTRSSARRSGSGPTCENENNQPVPNEGQYNSVTNSEALHEQCNILDASNSDCSPSTEILQETVAENSQCEALDDNLNSTGDCADSAPQVSASEINVHPDNDETDQSVASPVDDHTPESTCTDGLELSNSDILSKTPTISAEDLLLKDGVMVHNMNWQTFSTDVWDDQSSRVDFVITEPPAAPSRSFLRTDKRTSGRVVSEIDRKEVLEFPTFISRVLKTGGYVLLFIPLEMFEEWFNSFKSNGFNVMDSLYLFSYDPDTVPKRANSKFPQISMMADYALLAKAQGDHPSGFEPDFDSKFHQIPCSATRRSIVIEKIPFAKNKLTYSNTRMPVSLTEKPTCLLTEMIDLYCPVGGLVMDPYATTLKTPISCLQTSRRCTAIEQDKRCHKEALERLFRIHKSLTVQRKSSVPPAQKESSAINDFHNRDQPNLNHNISDDPSTISSDVDQPVSFAISPETTDAFTSVDDPTSDIIEEAVDPNMTLKQSGDFISGLKDNQDASQNHEASRALQVVQSSREGIVNDENTTETNTAVALLSLGNQRQRTNPIRTRKPGHNGEEGSADVDQKRKAAENEDLVLSRLQARSRYRRSKRGSSSQIALPKRKSLKR